VPGAHPYSLLHTIANPIARMLPLGHEQAMVYRHGEKLPPVGEMADHGPIWESVNLVLAARATLQARVNLQRNFHWIAVSTTVSSNVNGGFRAQFYDTRKALRLADRGVQMPNIAGNPNSASPFIGSFFLREPYRFDEPDSQLLIIAQNLETVTNTIDIVLYGVAVRFNAVMPHLEEFPGGLVSNYKG